MAVDVKTLRIGSHILVNGKRERVRGLDEDNGLIVRFPAEYVNANEVEPIPITPELLTKLGFGHILNTDMWTLKCDRTVQIGRISDKVWTITKYLCQFSLIERCTVRYLHEAEAFLALHNIELIKE